MITRQEIDELIVKNEKGYGLKNAFQQVLPNVNGARFVTMSGEEVSVDSPVSNSKVRSNLIAQFKAALLALDAVKMKELLYKNDLETPFILYESLEDGYVIRRGPYSIQEFSMHNPLPKLLKAYIKKHGSMRFDQYWNIANYFPALGVYNKLRHFDGYFSSAGALQNSTDYSLGLVNYVMSYIKDETKIKLIEIGAGTGDNLYRMLTALQRVTKVKIETYVIETSETLRLTQKNKLNKFKVKWVESLEQIPSNDTLTFIVSEMLFDSFAHRVFKKDGQKYHELYMTQDGYEFAQEGLDFTDPMIADIASADKWPDDSLIYRSLDAEDFFKKVLTQFKRFRFFTCDHTMAYMTTFSLYENARFCVPLHLVGYKQPKININKDAGNFMLACSLYLPLYEKVLKSISDGRYQIAYAKDFFKNIGGFSVYQDTPQFKVIVAQSDECHGEPL